MAEKAMRPDETGNPIHHTRKMSARLIEIRDHLRADIERVDEPQFKAMFETAAEVLEGLVTSFQHYEEKHESAWRLKTFSPCFHAQRSEGREQKNIKPDDEDKPG